VLGARLPASRPRPRFFSRRVWPVRRSQARQSRRRGKYIYIYIYIYISDRAVGDCRFRTKRTSATPGVRTDRPAAIAMFSGA